ncbi:MAG: class I SAM-dependent methyltransferase [Pseudomonadota bacterium]
MNEGAASETAVFVSLLRAHHFLNAPEPKILEDSLAMPLMGLPSSDVLQAQVDGVVDGFAKLSDRETAATFVKRIEHSVCVRSRLVEETIRDMKRANELEQFVLLGAGLDTTAYRNRSALEGVPIFEVDHPDSQSMKRKRLADAAVDLPADLSFVSYDFERQTLTDALRAGGVDDAKTTLFAFLGVQMYLTDASVQSTFKALAQFPTSSKLIMDFVMPDTAHDDQLTPDAVEQLAKVVEDMGEPFVSRYTEADLEERLKDAGFSDVHFHSTGEVVERFLGGKREAYSLPDRAVFLTTATR